MVQDMYENIIPVVEMRNSLRRPMRSTKKQIPMAVKALKMVRTPLMIS
jgi:hypothetical protein